MNMFINWMLVYYIPLFLVLLIVKFFNLKAGSIKRNVIVHLFIILSVILNIIMMREKFPIINSSFYMTLFFVCIIVSMLILGWFGAIYSLSVIIQELCVLMTAFLIWQELPLILVIFMIVPFFALSHLMQPKHWKIKIALTFLWGLSTILIFYILENIYLNIALHLLFGAIFIKIKILYPHSEFKILR